jgi:hypothetical protein
VGRFAHQQVSWAYAVKRIGDLGNEKNGNSGSGPRAWHHYQLLFVAETT